jgi:peptide methionine sulfoxide reductase msrA/msrB
MSEDFYTNLSPEERKIIVDKGTEAPFTGEYNEFFEAGLFICRACKTPLYESNTKFNAGCGWPSFDDELEGAVVRKEDFSAGRVRTEICCSKCDGHLGHVFEGEQITEKNTRHCVNSLSIQFKSYKNLSKVYFGAGCFWSVEKLFKIQKGVYLSQVGYMGGDTENPRYKDICTGDTNHAEVVEVYYDEKVISFTDLLNIFWENHNPTTPNQQGFDIGSQYRSVVFYTSENQKKIAEESILIQESNWNKTIVTEVIIAPIFYRAEEYHQNYLNKNNLGICGV